MKNKLKGKFTSNFLRGAETGTIFKSNTFLGNSAKKINDDAYKCYYADIIYIGTKKAGATILFLNK